MGQNETKREGITQVKAGKLRRTIKVITVREFKFEPTWTSAQIYGNVEGQPVTLMFTIPEDFPEELLPLRVKIGADWLNIGNQQDNSWQQLHLLVILMNLVKTILGNLNLFTRQHIQGYNVFILIPC
ncbi:MAG: hypothetical protein V8R91_02565 [Butyricimonas faecihominis]